MQIKRCRFAEKIYCACCRVLNIRRCTPYPAISSPHKTHHGGQRTGEPLQEPAPWTCTQKSQTLMLHVPVVLMAPFFAMAQGLMKRKEGINSSARHLLPLGQADAVPRKLLADSSIFARCSDLIPVSYNAKDVLAFPYAWSLSRQAIKIIQRNLSAAEGRRSSSLPPRLATAGSERQHPTSSKRNHDGLGFGLSCQTFPQISVYHAVRCAGPLLFLSVSAWPRHQTAKNVERDPKFQMLKGLSVS